MYNVDHAHGWCLSSSEKDIKSHRIGLSGDWELVCGCSRQSIGPLQEEKVLLTAASGTRLFHLIAMVSGKGIVPLL